MSASVYHPPIASYSPPMVSRFAPAAELDDLRKTKRDDRLWAIHGSPKARQKAQARIARLAELEREDGL